MLNVFQKLLTTLMGKKRERESYQFKEYLVMWYDTLRYTVTMSAKEHDCIIGS